MSNVITGYVIYDTTNDLYLQEDAVSYGDISGAGILTLEEIESGREYLFSDEVLVEVVREQQNTKRIDSTPIASTDIFNQ